MTPKSGILPPLKGGIKLAVSTAALQKMLADLSPSDREKLFVSVLLREGEMGITELKDITGTAPSTVYNTLRKLEEAGLVEKSLGKKRILTELGYEIASDLL